MKLPPSYMARLRKQDKEQPADYEICIRYRGDLISVGERYDNTWSLYVGNRCVDERFETRTAALDYLEAGDLRLTLS